MEFNLSVIKNELTMDSREIAKFFNKEHKNVKRDIINMLSKLNMPTFERIKDYEQTYIDSRGRTQIFYLLPEMESIVLASGYDIQMREQIVKEWLYLKKRYLQVRAKSKVVRNNFTNTLKAHGYRNPYEYIQTTKQMKAALGITAKKSDMTDKELSFVTASEYLADCGIDDEYGYHEVNPVCVDASFYIANYIAEKKQKKLKLKKTLKKEQENGRYKTYH